MTLGALIENLNTAYHQAGVESDSQVKIKLPDGREFDLKDCEVIKKSTPFSRWYQVRISCK